MTGTANDLSSVAPSRPTETYRWRIFVLPPPSRISVGTKRRGRRSKLGLRSIRPLRSHVSTLWRRWLRRTAVVPSEEILLNLHRDLIQPLLGPIRPVLVMPNLCLKLSHPAFSGSNLPGKFVSHFYGLLAICLSSTSRSVQQAQNCLACSVKRITSFGPTVRFRRKGNDGICYDCTAIAHGTPTPGRPRRM
jgi:hypothetical protein